MSEFLQGLIDDLRFLGGGSGLISLAAACSVHRSIEILVQVLASCYVPGKAIDDGSGTWILPHV